MEILSIYIKLLELFINALNNLDDEYCEKRKNSHLFSNFI